jgi:hypothetical protein
MENKVISEQAKDITVDGKEMKVTLKSYEQPIRKSELIELYSILEIYDGDVLWGQAIFPQQEFNETELNELFSRLDSSPNAFKLPR